MEEQVATGASVETLTYDVPTAAKRIGCSPRWLADECRAGRVEHAQFGQYRRFTAEQIELVIAKKTVKPKTALRARGYIPPAKRRSA